MRKALLWSAAGLGLVLGACARPYAPPGGEPDRLPPGLVDTSPAAFAVVTTLDEPAVFRFDERLRTRNFNRALLGVSPGNPADIEFRVKGNRIEVWPRGGWRPGQVYQVTVRPGVEDMFGNRREQAAELIFSTGPQVPPSAVAGLVQDRMTGRGARDAVVEAVRRNDSTVYRAWADTSAFFVLRNIPYGTYDVYAYADANRNSRRDPSEARHLGMTATVGPGQDTVQVFFELLPNDTTAPRVLRAEAIDSLQVRIAFDDAIDPDSGLVAATATVFALPDSTTPRPGNVTLQLEAAATAAAARRRAAADSIRADSAANAAAAKAAAAGEQAPARPPAQPQRPRATPGPGGPGATPAEPLPEKNVVLSTDQPFAPGNYAVVVRGAKNINGLVGGGSARFTVRPPAAPPARQPTDTVPGGPPRG